MILPHQSLSQDTEKARLHATVMSFTSEPAACSTMRWHSLRSPVQEVASGLNIETVQVSRCHGGPGGAASVVNIVQLVSEVAKAVCVVCEKLKNAPVEIKEVAFEAQCVHNIVVRVELSIGSNGLWLMAISECELRNAQADINQVLRDIESLLPTGGTTERLRSRARWIIGDDRTAERLIAKLASCCKRLEVLLQATTM